MGLHLSRIHQQVKLTVVLFFSFDYRWFWGAFVFNHMLHYFSHHEKMILFLTYPGVETKSFFLNFSWFFYSFVCKYFSKTVEKNASIFNIEVKLFFNRWLHCRFITWHVIFPNKEKERNSLSIKTCGLLTIFLSKNLFKIIFVPQNQTTKTSKHLVVKLSWSVVLWNIQLFSWLPSYFIDHLKLLKCSVDSFFNDSWNCFCRNSKWKHDSNFSVNT